MKKIGIIFIGLLFIYSCSGDSVSVAVSESIVSNDQVSFEIEGMTCEVGCAKRIESKLAKMEGVESSAIDFETKTATINFDNTKINKESFVKMVEDLNDHQYKVKEQANNNESLDSDSESSKSDFNQVITGNSFELPNIIDFFTNII